MGGGRWIDVDFEGFEFETQDLRRLGWRGEGKRVTFSISIDWVKGTNNNYLDLKINQRRCEV